MFFFTATGANGGERGKGCTGPLPCLDLEHGLVQGVLFAILRLAIQHPLLLGPCLYAPKFVGL